MQKLSAASSTVQGGRKWRGGCVAHQTILQLVHTAAGFAKENTDMFWKWHRSFRIKADRAEQWLHRVYAEIEDRFLRQSDTIRGVPQWPQSVRHRSDLN